jgi:hypothetical protein
MNITTMSGKGRIAGSCSIYHPQQARWVNCARATFSIPGDIHEIRCSLWRSFAALCLPILAPMLRMLMQ